MVVFLGLETGGIFTIDWVATGSFCVGITGGSDSDWNPDPLSDSSGVDSTNSSAKSSSSMGGVVGFAFHLDGVLNKGGSDSGHLGCWDGGAGCCRGGGGEGSVLGG